MSHSWTPTIIITKELAKKLIEQQHHLSISSLEVLGEGWDNIAYLVNNELVFRFPRREMGIECLENEISILPYISTYVSFPFSYPQYIGKPSDIYPAPFAGYKMIQGTPLCETQARLITDVNFAKTLALWLKELHSISVRSVHNTHIKGDQLWRYDVKFRLDKSKERILEYQSYFIDAGFDINDLLKIVEKLYVHKFDHVEKKSYIHGDLYSRHILVNDNQLCGIIDWGDIHIGNPGTDLSIGFMIFSDNALEAFFDTYGLLTQETKNIALLRTLSHSIALLTYCYEKNEYALKEWSMLALKNAIEKISIHYTM